MVPFRVRHPALHPIESAIEVKAEWDVQFEIAAIGVALGNRIRLRASQIAV